MSITLTREQAIKAGGNLWEKNGKARVYFNAKSLLDLEVSYYKTGNISSATLNGEDISNAEAGRILDSKIWFDKDGLHLQTSARWLTLDDIEAAITKRLAEAENTEESTW